MKLTKLFANDLDGFVEREILCNKIRKFNRTVKNAVLKKIKRA